MEFKYCMLAVAFSIPLKEKGFDCTESLTPCNVPNSNEANSLSKAGTKQISGPDIIYNLCLMFWLWTWTPRKVTRYSNSVILTSVSLLYVWTVQSICTNHDTRQGQRAILGDWILPFLICGTGQVLSCFCCTAYWFSISDLPSQSRSAEITDVIYQGCWHGFQRPAVGSQVCFRRCIYPFPRPSWYFSKKPQLRLELKALEV